MEGCDDPSRRIPVSTRIRGWNQFFSVHSDVGKVRHLRRPSAVARATRTHCPGPFGHLTMQPASSGMLVPVMCREASEARKSTNSATSSGSIHGVGRA